MTNIEDRLPELTIRVGFLGRSVADLHVQLASHSVHMDRIKRRLDLVDAR